MTPRRDVQIGIYSSLCFFGCVLWAIVEAVAKTDRDWSMRFHVAMGGIGLSVLGFAWLVRRHVVGTCNDNRTNADRDAAPAEWKETRRIPPLYRVDILVDVENEHVDSRGDSVMEVEDAIQSDHTLESEIQLGSSTIIQDIESDPSETTMLGVCAQSS